MGKKYILLLRNVKVLWITGSFLVSFSALATEIKLPVEPGISNAETLNGIDSNKNNVRDDIEILIYNKISKEPVLYKAYLNLAESKLMKMKNYEDIEKIKFFDNQSYNDIVCIQAVESNSSGKISENMFLISRAIYNTKERSKVDKILADKHHLISKTRYAIQGKNNMLKLCR